MSINIKSHISKLGFQGKDKVTGFSGVISSVSFDLYGCIQCVLTPPIDKDGKPQDGRWFDLNRIDVSGDSPVMDVPNFEYGAQAEGRQGAAEKPISSKV